MLKTRDCICETGDKLEAACRDLQRERDALFRANLDFIQQNAELRVENEALKQDAERYRWLRSVFSAAKNLVDNSYTPSCDGDRQRWLMLKAAIDAAMKGGE